MLETLTTSLAATLEAAFWPPLIDRAVLALNHVLRGDASATQRLVAHAGKAMRIDWSAPPGPWPRPPALRLVVTPAGLFEVVTAAPTAPTALPEALTIAVDLPSPFAAAQLLAAGERPTTRIEGDTALAADIAWLADHLRWDAEHDLARVVGDTPARWIATSAGAVFTSLKGFAAAARQRRGPGAADAGTTSAR